MIEMWEVEYEGGAVDIVAYDEQGMPVRSYREGNEHVGYWRGWKRCMGLKKDKDPLIVSGVKTREIDPTVKHVPSLWQLKQSGGGAL